MGECQNRGLGIGCLRGIGGLGMASGGVDRLRHVDVSGGWVKTCGALLASLFCHCLTYPMGDREMLRASLPLLLFVTDGLC